MILKMKDEHIDGYIYIDKVKKIALRYNGCFHYVDGCGLQIVKFNEVIDPESGRSIFKKDCNSIILYKYSLLKLSSEQIEKFKGEDICGFKGIYVETDKEEFSYIGNINTPIYVLNDEGKTIDEI